MFGYMTEIDTVEMTDTQEIEAEGKASDNGRVALYRFSVIIATSITVAV